MKNKYLISLFQNNSLRNPRKGFTLIELLVVVLIIGILAAIALPQYEKSVEKSRAAEGIMRVRSIAQANDRYYLANGTYSKNIQDLDLEFPGEYVLVDTAPSLQTKAFSCRATNNASNDAIVAVCRRVNSDYSYYFEVFKSNTNEIVCGGDNEKGKQLCSLVGSKKGNSDVWYL